MIFILYSVSPSLQVTIFVRRTNKTVYLKLAPLKCLRSYSDLSFCPFFCGDVWCLGLVI